jgi:hypothetical protein
MVTNLELKTNCCLSNQICRDSHFSNRVWLAKIRKVNELKNLM